MPSEQEAPLAVLNSPCPKSLSVSPGATPAPPQAFLSSPEAIISSDRSAHILNQFIDIWNIIPQEETC